MIKKLSYIILLYLPLFSNGQDIHFSQTTRSFFQINPGFCGTFSGNIKAEINWKDQWQSINNTFRTYGSSIQFSFGKGNPRMPVFFAAGIQAFKDVAGDVEVGNTAGGITFSTLVKVDRNSRLTLGLQGNYGVTGLDPTKMQWGSQYNGLNFDPALTNGSGIDFQGFSYADISAGIGYWYTKRDRNVIASAPQDAKIGLAVYHLNRPKFTYGNSTDKDNILKMRFVLHGSALLGSDIEDLYWYPNLNVMFQGKQHEILLGCIAKYRLKSASKTTGFNGEWAISGGLDLRITNVIDAIIPQVYIGISHFDVGLSYDVNLSSLNNASNFRGGFELSIRFINPDGYIHRNPWRRGISI